jgi:hypothetical protein
MRQCKCGGKVREHVLKENRVAWTCGDCGRYEVISLQRGAQERREDDVWVLPVRQKDHGDQGNPSGSLDER